MPKYYHIHRSPEPSTLEKELIKGQVLYFLKRIRFGIDATANFIANFKYLEHIASEPAMNITPEGYLWDFPPAIRIRKIKIFDTSKQHGGSVSVSKNNSNHPHKYLKYKKKYLYLKSYYRMLP